MYMEVMIALSDCKKQLLLVMRLALASPLYPCVTVTKKHNVYDALVYALQHQEVALLAAAVTGA